MITANIEKAILVKNNKDIDLTADLVTFVVVESVSEKILTAAITFDDSEKLFSLVPYNGSEKIKIEVDDILNSKKYNFEFAVISKMDMAPQESSSQRYTLSLIETNYFNFIKEYSTSFSNKPISNFVSNFSSNTLKKDLTTVEQSEGKFTFAFPYQKFHYMLSYLNQYLTSVNGYNTYFYFSTLTNGAVFSTLQNLIKKPQGSIYYLSENKFTQSSPIKVTEFASHKKNESFDIRNTLLSKQGSSKVQRYDYATKSVIEKTIKYSDVIQNYKLLGKYSIYDKKIMDQPSYTYYASTDNNKNETLIEQGLFTTSEEQYEISFDGDLSRSCGKTCYIQFADDTPTNSDDFSPKTGYYFITDITHTFTSQGYSQILTVIKNGMEYKISDDQIETKEI